jgi:hypothetical protein
VVSISRPCDIERPTQPVRVGVFARPDVVLVDKYFFRESLLDEATEVVPGRAGGYASRERGEPDAALAVPFEHAEHRGFMRAEFALVGHDAPSRSMAAHRSQ